MRILFLSIAVWSGLVFGAQSKPMTMDEIKQLSENLKKAQHVSVDFDMIQTRKLRNRPVVKTGSAQFAKPNMFLWELESKPKSIQVYDGKTFTRYTPESNEAQVFSTKGGEFKSIARLIDMVLDLSALTDSYDIVSKNWQDKNAILVLRPKVADSDIRDVELKISSEFSMVKDIKMNFHSGNTTEIKFKNLARKKLDPKVFALNLPKGTKIIDVK